MADATYFYGAKSSFTLLACPVAMERSFSLIIPNGSTPSPPTHLHMGLSVEMSKKQRFISCRLTAAKLMAIVCSLHEYPHCEKLLTTRKNLFDTCAPFVMLMDESTA